MTTTKLVRCLTTCVAGISISISSYGQIADDKCKFLGNIIAASTPTDFSTYWNQVTPENAGKWGSVEATRDVMQWAQLDNAYQTAKSKGIPFKQHTLVWGQQQPAWIGSLPPVEQKEEVEEWIKLFCERYPETDYIDVVNEPLHAVPDYRQALGTGWDWMIWAFEKARQYCPNAKLILNDYNIINNDGATTAYVGLINILKEKNLIDIVGEQGHFLETTPVATVKSNLDKLHATGLPIHISEFDINLANDTDQRNKYQDLFPVLWTHPGVQGVTLWGYRQNEIWRTDAYLLRSNGSERPAFTWLKSYIPTAPGGTFCLVTGINSEAPRVSLHPNPATDGHIAIETDESGYLAIYDMQQKLLQSSAVVAGANNQFVIDGPPAIYIVKVNTNGKCVVFKVLVR